MKVIQRTLVILSSCSGLLIVHIFERFCDIIHLTQWVTSVRWSVVLSAPRTSDGVTLNLSASLIPNRLLSALVLHKTDKSMRRGPPD